MSPFLKIGITFATFKELGTQPVVNERLQMYSRRGGGVNNITEYRFKNFRANVVETWRFIVPECRDNIYDFRSVLVNSYNNYTGTRI